MGLGVYVKVGSPAVGGIGVDVGKSVTVTCVRVGSSVVSASCDDMGAIAINNINRYARMMR